MFLLQRLMYKLHLNKQYVDIFSDKVYCDNQSNFY